jgi:hypothetical protein
MSDTDVQQPQKPTPDLVREYVTRFDQDRAASDTDRALSKLFELLPDNRVIEDVLLKVVAVNSLLSTGILATYVVAKHICELDIDLKIRQGLPEVVNQIASVEIAGQKRRNYSFAAKFCSFHVPESFPKYDTNTKDLIWAYQELYKFADVQQVNELKDYPKYKATVERFRSYFGLDEFSFKQIDNFLWGYGGAWAKEKALFRLGRRLRSASDPTKAKHLGDQLGRMVFGE